MAIHKAIKKSILGYLILCLPVSLSTTLQAAALAAQPDAQESYDYTLQNHSDQVSPIKNKAYLDIEEMPEELNMILNAISDAPLPQLLSMVGYDTSTQHYSKYLFASSGLLTDSEVQQKAHQLNYHLIKASKGPVTWQMLSFFGEQPKLKVIKCILPQKAPLCFKCGYIATHLFEQDLIMKKSGCQGQSWPQRPPTAKVVKAFHSPRFSDQQRQLTIAAIGDIFAHKASPQSTRPDTPHSPIFQPIQPEISESPLHAAVQFKSGIGIGIKIIEILLADPQIAINALDSSGKTPLDYAEQGNDVYHLLVQHGAKTSQQLTQNQAYVEPPSTSDSENRHSDKEQATRPLPSDQLLIPANGQCLYTTIIMGYLLPVREDSAKVIARINQLFGMQPANLVNKLQNTLQNSTHYLTYLHSDAFSRLVTDFMALMQIKKGTWGGSQEIQTIATKLKVNIQEYYPDPSNHTTLLLSDFTNPTEAVADITLHIVRDRVHPAEVLTQAEKASAKDNPHYQHYRLKHTMLSSKERATEEHVAQWFSVAESGNRKLLEDLYNNYNINVNTSNSHGETALMKSATNGHLSCLKFLMQQGADIHKKDKSSATACIWSASKGHLDCLQFLHQQGADIHHKNKHGTTSLLLSASHGHLACLKFLHQQGADIHVQDHNGDTALLWSAYHGQLDCLQFLHQQGADIHAQDHNGDTALLWSASHGHLACLQFLHQQGADIHAQDHNGDTALLWSAYKSHLSCVQYLVQQGADIHHKNKEKGKTALLLSAAQDDLACLHYLVQQGADIHAQDHDGDTALLWSAYKGHLRCVKYLVQQGADITWQGKGQKNALQCAKERGQQDIINYLSTLPKKKKPDKAARQKWFAAAQIGNIQSLKKRYSRSHINVNISTTDGDTALLLSAKEGHLDYVKCLVEQNAHIHHKNKIGKTALLLSAERGHLACVKYLVQQGVDIHAKNKHGDTALVASTQQGHLACVKYLVQQGADMHDKNKWQETALVYSAQEGHLGCLEFLFEQGANIHDKNWYGNTALILSAQNGHLDCVKYLVQKGANIHDKNENGETALILSTQKGHLACLEFLLERGADIHVEDKHGDTALLRSASRGDSACVEYLVAQGADLASKGYQKKTALQFAQELGKDDLVEFLSKAAAAQQKWFAAVQREKGDSHLLAALYRDANINVNIRNANHNTALIFSACYGHLACLKWLCQQKANVQAKNKRGDTALILSAYQEHLDCLKFLHKQGANIHHKNENEATVLIFSAYHGHLACVKYLVQQGANIHDKNKKGGTALYWSVREGHLDCLKFLHKQGADIHCTDENGTPAFILSAYHGHLDCVKYLIQQGADIHCTDENGMTALIFSANNGHLDCVQYLVPQGTDIHHKNKNGATALILSANNGHLDCVQYLVEKGANIHDKNKWGDTALHWSAQEGHLDCVKYLLQQGADIHHKNKNGTTALILSASHGYLACVEFFHQQGAHIKHKNKNNDTALILSAANGHLACVKYLLQQGADPTWQGQYNKTALDWAREKGQEDMVNYLSPHLNPLHIVLDPFLLPSFPLANEMSMPPTIAIKPLPKFLSQMDCYPSPYELAYLSKHTYGKTLKVQQHFTIPDLSHPAPIWTVIKIFTSKQYSSYKAVLYLCHTKQQMVLTFQGTNNRRDWTSTNIPSVVFKSPTKGQHTIIKGHLEESITIVEAKHTTLTATGHSLGGWLAQVASLRTEQYYKRKGRKNLKRIHLKTVTFDAPGTGKILDKLKDQYEQITLEKLDITSCLSSPNVVNATNQHIGTVYRVVFKQFNKSSMMGKIKDRRKIYTLASHTINNFVESLRPQDGKCNDFTPIHKWPNSLSMLRHLFTPDNNWDHVIEDPTERFLTENKTDYAYGSFEKYTSHIRHLSKAARDFLDEVKKRPKRLQNIFFTQYIGGNLMQDEDSTLTTENENQDIRLLLDRLEWLLQHYEEEALEALLDDVYSDQVLKKTITPLRSTDNLPPLPHQVDAQAQSYILSRTATLTTTHCRLFFQKTIIFSWLRPYAYLVKSDISFNEISHCIVQYCTLAHPMYALIGYGGLGKSTFAKLYAKRYYKDTKYYQHAWWLNIEDEDTLATSIHEVCQKMGITFNDKMFPEKGMQEIAKQLTDHPHWLLILDNANPTKASTPIKIVLKHLPKQPHHNAVIITSRDSNKDSWNLYNISPMPLEMFSPDEAEQLLHRFHTPTHRQEQQALTKLITAVKKDNLLPLTLSQIGHYIKEEAKKGIQNPYAQCGQHYQDERRRIDALKVNFDQHIFHKSIFATLNATLNKIEDLSKHDKANNTTYSEALQIIKIIAFLHPDGLDWWVLQYVDSSRIKKKKVEETVKCLRAYGILLDRGNSCATHRTIQAIMRWKITNDAKNSDKTLKNTKEAALKLLETLQLQGYNDLSQQLIVEELRFTTLAHCHALMQYLTFHDQKIRLLKVISQADSQIYLKNQLYLPPQTIVTKARHAQDFRDLHTEVLSFIKTTPSNFNSKRKIFDYHKYYTPLLLIQGDAGTGKSTYASYLVQELWATYQNKKGAHVPLFISLPEFCQEGKIPTNIIELALKKRGLDEDTIRRFKTKACINKPRLFSGVQPWVFIFDGYDEIHGQQNLFTHCNLKAWGTYHTKYIITCRTTYLTELGEVSKKSYFQDNNEVFTKEYTIAPYAKDQIEGYVDKFASSSYNLHKETWDTQRYQTALSKLPELKEWMTTPFLLVVGLQALPRIAAAQKETKLPPSRISIYDTFVEEWLYREENKLQHKIDKATLLAFCEELGYTLWEQDTTTLKKEDKHMTTFFENTYALQSAPLRYLGNNRYMFIHADFRDFFAASFILTNITKNRLPRNLSSFNPIINDFFSHHKHKLLHYMRSTQQQFSIAVSNSIQVLYSIGHQDFHETCLKKLDLSNINLAKARLPQNLSNVNLNGANLSHTDLRHMKLPKKLPNTNLSGATLPKDLSSINLNGTNLSRTNLTHVKLPKELSNTNLSGAILPKDLSSINLNGTNLSHTNLTHVKLPKELSHTNLSGATLPKDLSSINLNGTNLSHTNLTNVKLPQELSHTNLSGAILPRNLSKHNLTHADLSRTNLTHIKLPKELSYTNLSGVTFPKDLSSINLNGANLSKTNLTHVKLPKNLSGVNFTDAQLPKDLSNHNFTHANLTRQRFTSTKFEGTQLEEVILTSTLCDYQQCFQAQTKVNKLSRVKWYVNNLPKDLKSIAKVYPRLSQDSHKVALLQIASGLAYLVYWKKTEFYIKAAYWSCKLLLLKEKLSSRLGKQLVCSLADGEYGLNYDAKECCWQTGYHQHQNIETATETPHKDFDQYLKTFQAGLRKYNCKSKKKDGYNWYKSTIEENIQGLKKAYPKLIAPELQREAIDIAFQLSTLYQNQHLFFLFRYLFLQNRLIKLKISAGEVAKNEVHYNFGYTNYIRGIWGSGWE